MVCLMHFPSLAKYLKYSFFFLHPPQCNGGFENSLPVSKYIAALGCVWTNQLFQRRKDDANIEVTILGVRTYLSFSLYIYIQARAASEVVFFLLMLRVKKLESQYPCY